MCFLLISCYNILILNIYNNTLKKINNNHLYVLIGIVFILNTILFNTINISKAEQEQTWRGPTGTPGTQTVNIPTNPLKENLNLGPFNIVGDGSIDIEGNINVKSINIDDANLSIFGFNGTQERINIAGDGSSPYIELFYEGITNSKISTIGDSYFNGGNVGIGTTEPKTKLHIYKGDSGVQGVYSYEYTTAVFENNNHSMLEVWSPSDKQGGFYFTDPDQYAMSEFVYNHDNDSFRLASRPIAGVSMNTHMYIDGATGNVGIGNVDPWAKLHVMGSTVLGTADSVNVILASHPRLNSEGNIEGTGFVRGTNIGEDPESDDPEDSGSSEFDYTDSLGDFHSENGAFWAAPMLHRSQRIPDDPTNGISAFPWNEYGEFFIQGTSYGSHYNKGISFVTWDGVNANDPDIRMRINEVGNVGIGTTMPNRKLHVKTNNSDDNVNAEIDIQSGDNDYWGIYQNNNDGSLNFWKKKSAEELTHEGNNPSSSVKENRLIIDSAGSLFMGGGNLHIGTQAYIDGGGEGGELWLDTWDSTAAWSLYAGNNGLKISKGDNDSFIINNSGELKTKGIYSDSKSGTIITPTNEGEQTEVEEVIQFPYTNGESFTYLLTLKLWGSEVHIIDTYLVHTSPPNVNLGFTQLLHNTYNKGNIEVDTEDGRGHFFLNMEHEDGSSDGSNNYDSWSDNRLRIKYINDYYHETYPQQKWSWSYTRINL